MENYYRNFLFAMSAKRARAEEKQQQSNNNNYGT